MTYVSFGSGSKFSECAKKTFGTKNRVITKPPCPSLFRGDPAPNPASLSPQNTTIQGQHQSGLKVGFSKYPRKGSHGVKQLGTVRFVGGIGAGVPGRTNSWSAPQGRHNEAAVIRQYEFSRECAAQRQGFDPRIGHKRLARFPHGGQTGQGVEVAHDPLRAEEGPEFTGFPAIRRRNPQNGK